MYAVSLFKKYAFLGPLLVLFVAIPITNGAFAEDAKEAVVTFAVG